MIYQAGIIYHAYQISDRLKTLSQLLKTLSDVVVQDDQKML